VRLVGCPDVEVAVLSGRRLDDLEEHLGVPGVFLAGQAGLETRMPSGSRKIHVEAADRLPAGLIAEMQTWVSGFPGAWIEDKGLAVAIHYREVELSRHRDFVAGLRRRLVAHGDGVVPVLGKRVFELMPAVGRDKGSALEDWLGDRVAKRLAFYLGDDNNDEPALAWVRGHGGVSVAVGRTSSQAEFGLSSPADVVWFLEWLEREWRSCLEQRATRANGVPSSARATSAAKGRAARVPRPTRREPARGKSR
jgi:trehalose-phosphatase